MQLHTLWLSSEEEPEAVPVDAASLFEEPVKEFPVFNPPYTESKLDQMARWLREHKDLARRQDAFVLRHLCHAVVTELKATEYTFAPDFREKLSHAFDPLIATRHLQFINITVAASLDTEKFGLTAVYQYLASSRTHTIHVRNYK